MTKNNFISKSFSRHYYTPPAILILNPFILPLLLWGVGTPKMPGTINKSTRFLSFFGFY